METAKSRILNENAHRGTRQSLSIVERLFLWLLRGIEHGSLEVVLPSGASRLLGNPHLPVSTLRIHRTDFFRKLFASGSVGLGESYVDGDWDSSDLTALLTLLAKNQKEIGPIRNGFSFAARKLNRMYHRARRNTVETSVANIQEHYDLSNAFYETFLDSTMTYSSACFESANEALETAQIRKMDRMLDLAGVSAGDSVLEIGSGWGGLALRAAKRGCTVRTVTLSREQYDYAKALFAAEGCEDKVTIEEMDYRHLEGQYDAVLSCEMIEAVGKEYLDSYFAKIRDCLKPGAKAVLQAITIPDERYERYSNSCDWIQKHIFPGGHLPSPGAIGLQVEKSGELEIRETYSFGRDYAETLKRWAEAFNGSRAEVDRLGFDPTFCRKWNYYFSYCQAGFLTDLIDVRHVVLQSTKAGISKSR